MQKPILILFWTHGDEYCLKQCLDFIQPNYTTLFDTFDVNQIAIEQNKRYLIHNMNRTAPGDASSEDYELKRWAEVNEVMKKYQIVIDIHGTDSDTGSFILLPKATAKHLIISSFFLSENIVLWQSGLLRNSWPVVAFHPLWVEIETGPMNWEMDKQLAENLNSFFENYAKKHSFSDFSSLLQKKNVYNVTARLEKSSLVFIPQCDFQKVIVDSKVYYTLLTANPYQNTKCYLMEKVDTSWLFLSPFTYFSSPVMDII